MTEPAVKPTGVRYIVLLGLCLAAGLAYVHRLCLGSAQITIRETIPGLTKGDTGRAMSIFFWTYALFQIPTGLLVDAWGARRSLLLFGLLGAVTVALGAGTLVVGAAAGFTVLFVSRALMGVAQAGLFPASTRCIATWLPLRQRAFAAGTLQACMSVGAAIGAPILGILLVTVQWPWVFLIVAVPGVLWSVWFYLWFRDRPTEHSSVNAAERALLAPPAAPTTPPVAPTLGTWLRIARHPKLVWLCSSQFFRAAANVFWLTWCPTFLCEVYQLDAEAAGWLLMFPFLGVVVGSFLGGILADRVLASTGSKRWSRQGVAIITAAVGVALFLLAYALPLGVYAAVALLFLAAVFSSGANPCSYSVSIDIGGRYMAVAFGAMNMLGNFGAALFPEVAPTWMREFGTRGVLLLLAALYAAGIFCWVFVDPNGTIDEEKPHPPKAGDAPTSAIRKKRTSSSRARKNRKQRARGKR